jgi:hypothetical protein
MLPIKRWEGPALTTLLQFTHFYSVWGVIWLVQAIVYFGLGLIVGLLVFKVSLSDSPFFFLNHLERTTYLIYQENAQQQASDANHFLPVPGSTNAALSLLPSCLVLSALTLSLTAVGLL